MAEQLDWPTIKSRHPELARRLRDGDLDARIEFARLSFGGEIIAEQPLTPQQRRSRPQVRPTR